MSSTALPSARDSVRALLEDVELLWMDGVAFELELGMDGALVESADGE